MSLRVVCLLLRQQCCGSNPCLAQSPVCTCREFIVSGKEPSASLSRGGQTQGTAQDESELEQKVDLELKKAGVSQEDTVLAPAAAPGEPASALSDIRALHTFSAVLLASLTPAAALVASPA